MAARAFGCLFLTAGILTLLTSLLPGSDNGLDLAGVVLTLATIALGAGCLLAAPLGRHGSTLSVAVACGTLLISGSITSSAAHSTAGAFYYLWIVLLSFYFLPVRHASAHLLLTAVAYGVVLAAVESPARAVEHWVTAVGTLGAVGPLVRLLKNRVERLIHGLAEAARRDPLTGLLNRRGFTHELDDVIQRCTRRNEPTGLIKVDLDYFKEINENFGQVAGDMLLQKVAWIFESAVDDAGLGFTARMGGEDFAVTLPGQSSDATLEFANRLRDLANDHFADEEVQVTMSFGVAASPTDGEDGDALVRSADAALFAAKEFGRNRAVQFSDNLRSIMPRLALRRAAQREVHVATLVTLAEVLDLRDASTSNHSRTVGSYAEMMARELGLAEKTIERIRIAGVLHDIGKIGIPDSILMKPSKLTDDEWVRMKSHPEIGARILAAMELTDIREWVLYHHERPDGRGYPRGLRGDEIPLAARILAVADSYEAMTAERVYKAAMSHEDAAAELRRCMGSQFDPDVTEAFLRAISRTGNAAVPSKPRDGTDELPVCEAA